MEPGNVRIHSSLLLTLHYLIGQDPESLLDRHRQWPGNALRPTSSPVRTPRATRPDRLRIGYV
jgi:hypothetical protein